MDNKTRTYEIFDGPDGRLARFASLSAYPNLVHALTPKGTWLLPPDLSVLEHSERCDALAQNQGLSGAAWLSQVHGNRVIQAREAGLLGEADALVCDEPGLGIIVRGADCPLILATAHGAKGWAVGAAHASWRGTVARVSEAMLEALLDLCQGEAASVTAAIAPSAGPCCYEVGEELREQALDALGSSGESFFERRDGSLYFDLWAANRAQMLAVGCRPEKVSVAAHCSMCRNEDFPSWRKEGKAAGRMAALIGIHA
ncbi:polyphenol oxidase family protein [bacterium]|nr:polyphenol oxidase family protein [bacterium]